MKFTPDSCPPECELISRIVSAFQQHFCWFLRTDRKPGNSISSTDSLGSSWTRSRGQRTRNHSHSRFGGRQSLQQTAGESSCQHRAQCPLGSHFLLWSRPWLISWRPGTSSWTENTAPVASDGFVNFWFLCSITSCKEISRGFVFCFFSRNEICPIQRSVKSLNK